MDLDFYVQITHTIPYSGFNSENEFLLFNLSAYHIALKVALSLALKKPFVSY